MELITITQMQKLYGIGRRTAIAWAIASGSAIKRLPGQKYRVNKEQLERWLQRESKRKSNEKI